MGVLYGAVLGVFAGVRQGWVSGVITGVGGGAVFGPAMLLVTGPYQENLLLSAGPLAPAELSAAVRAAGRGPQPGDTAGVLVGAVGITRYRIEMMNRRRRLSLWTVVGVLLMTVVLGVTDSRWWWLLAVFCVGGLIVQLSSPGRLNRRLALLEAAVPAGSIIDSNCV